MNCNIRTTFLMACIIIFSLFPADMHSQWKKVIVDSLSSGATLPCAGDLLDDGDIDIAVLSILSYGPPSGGIVLYDSPGMSGTTLSSDFGVIQLTDVTGNGTTDILTADMVGGTVQWYEGPEFTRNLVSPLPEAVGVNLADIDNDGMADVVATGVSPNRVCWFKAPDWSYNPIVSEEDCPADPTYLITEDIDNDGDIDILTATEEGLILFHSPSWTMEVIFENEPGYIDAGDIDGDGDIDLIIAEPAANHIAWLENPDWTVHTVDESLSGCFYVTSEDLDRDGDIDIAATGSNSSEVIWYESPEWNRNVIDANMPGAYGICTADMNNDTWTDVIVCSQENGRVVYYESMLATSSDEIIFKLPEEFVLSQNYPNPFNPATTIKYSIPANSIKHTVDSRKNHDTKNPLLGGDERGGLVNVQLKVYNIPGREVATLVNESKSPGHYQVKWDASRFASGVYFYTLSAGNFIETKKMVLIR